jgi:pheromone shutdown protein TraB
MREGATLVGTESPTLLLDEYRLLQSSENTPGQAAALLEARDRFIAERIDATLHDDEDGVLFIGALHKVARFLPQRIKVEYLAMRGQ